MRILVQVVSLLTLTVAQAGAQCLGDFNGDGKVTISELIIAVNSAVNGCPPTNTITSTPPPTSTATWTPTPTITVTGTPTATMPRFVDNGDGTVTDHGTGLMWEKKDNSDGTPNFSDPHDVDNFYYVSGSGIGLDGTAYTDFLSKLNNGASADGGPSTPIKGCLGRHCDWRVPTIVELQGIVDATQGFCGGARSGACIDPAFGPTQTFTYSSATAEASNPYVEWAVNFGDGKVIDVGKSSTFPIRAVRGGL